MTFLAFQDAFSHFPVIPVLEIEKAFPEYDRNALTRWQKKGYVEKIRRGFYRLAKRNITSEPGLFFIANRIYTPSFISLESALWWHNFIPEVVFTVTSVSTRKTQIFETPVGHFSYQSIKKELFFGYQLEKFKDFHFKIADPAKALLDFLYFHSHIDNEDRFFELRLNFWEVQEKLNLNDYNDYLRLFSSKALESRAHKLIQFLRSHDVIV